MTLGVGLIEIAVGFLIFGAILGYIIKRYLDGPEDSRECYTPQEEDRL